MVKRMNMTRTLLLAITLVLTAIGGRAAVLDNDYFSLSSPDDSWYLNDDNGALHSIGARAQIYRNDAQHKTLELGRIDCIDAAFEPAQYLHQQLVEQNDLLAKGATGFSAVTDTVFLGLPAKQLTFTKTQGERQYRFLAIAFNAGFHTFSIVQGHRSDVPNVVGWIIGNTLRLKCNTQQLTTVAQYVASADSALSRHRLPVYRNEYLERVGWSADSTTIDMEVMIPYVEADKVDVPTFVQGMHDHWLHTFAAQVRLNLLYAAIVREQRAIRYTYTDSRGNEIGTLLITPPEYQMLLGK